MNGLHAIAASLPFGLFVLLCLLQAADLVTTLLAFRSGAKEANGGLRELQGLLGRDAGIVLAKLVIVGLLVYAWRSGALALGSVQLVLLVLACVYVRTVWNNVKLIRL